MFPCLPQGLRSSKSKQISMKLQTLDLKEVGFWSWQWESQVLPFWSLAYTVNFFCLEFGMCFPIGNNSSTKEMKVIPYTHVELDSFQSTVCICFTRFSPQPCEVNTSDVITLIWELRKREAQEVIKSPAKYSQLFDGRVQTRYSLDIPVFFFPINCSLHSQESRMFMYTQWNTIWW